MNVEWVINYKDAIPHHSEVHWQVTDVTSLVVVLTKTETEKDVKLK